MATLVDFSRTSLSFSHKAVPSEMLRPSEKVVWCLHLSKATISHGGSLSSTANPMRCCSSSYLTHWMWIAASSPTGARQLCWLFSQLHLAGLHTLEDADIFSGKRVVLAVMLYVALHRVCLLAEMPFGNSAVVLQRE